MEAENRMIGNVAKVTALLALALGIFYAINKEIMDGAAIVIGAGLGIANLLIIKKLLEVCLIKEKRESLAITALLLVKFPLIYVAGYFVLAYSGLPLLYLTIGLSLLFISALALAAKNALVNA